MIEMEIEVTVKMSYVRLMALKKLTGLMSPDLVKENLGMSEEERLLLEEFYYAVDNVIPTQAN